MSVQFPQKDCKTKKLLCSFTEEFKGILSRSWTLSRSHPFWVLAEEGEGKSEPNCIIP